MSLTRRSFLKVSAAAGGGLALGLALPARAQAPVAEINAWVIVHPNDSVTIRYARSEMGQGSMTATAQLVAEELDCDWSRVRVEYADTHAQLKRRRPWGDMASTASGTIRHSQEYLRRAGATARLMLVAAAAQAWDVPANECSSAGGVIRHEASGRRVSYGRVAAAAAKLEAPAEVTLKPPERWRIAGKPVARVDIPDIVTGRARFGIDARLPGLAYAAVAHCPVFGGKLKSIDPTAVEGRRGVLKVLPMGDFVAVVADNWWRAREALRALPVAWDANPAASSESILASLREGLDAHSVVLAKKEGEAGAVLGYVDRVFEAEYYAPLLAHLTLEPQSCTAVVKDGQVDVWASTQDAEATHAVAAAVAGVPPEHVYVHRTQAGGAFGRRLTQDFVRRGVAIARAMGGVPVATLWSREEDTQHDRYRPASLVRLRAGLDDAGYPAAWSARVSALAIPGAEATAVAGLADQPYRIRNVLVEHVPCPSPVPVGFWRGMAYSQNPFARECFLDELAQAAGIDPLDYRRALLPAASRERIILETTAHAAHWPSPAPGVHRGIAVSEAFGSYVAAAAELSLKDKRVHLRRLVIGIDPGHVVNPDTVAAQVQGSAAFMLSALFWGEITLKDGVNSWEWSAVFALFITLIATFPSGRPPRGPGLARLGRIALWSLPFLVAATGFTAHLVGPLTLEEIDNPIGFLPDWVGIAGLLVIVGIFVVSVVSLVIRRRRVTGQERAQFSWVVFSATLLVMAIVGTFLAIAASIALGNGDPGDEVWLVTFLMMLLFPISFGVAILRYRLYQIDRIISRTVTYSLVLATLAMVYLGAVAALSTVLPATSQLAVAASTLSVVLLFNPLRRRVQSAVGRRFDRRGYDAQRLGDEFAARLQLRSDPRGVIDGWVAVVDEAMRPSTVGVWLSRGGET